MSCMLYPKLVPCSKFLDQRGYFAKIPIGLSGVKQVNFSFNEIAGTVRGMHRQDPLVCEDVKMVSCLVGSILDVCLSIIDGEIVSSMTFDLCAEDDFALVVPADWYHGFQTMEDGTLLSYVHTGAFIPSGAQRISPLSPALIDIWPIPITKISGEDRFAQTVEKHL